MGRRAAHAVLTEIVLFCAPAALAIVTVKTPSLISAVVFVRVDFVTERVAPSEARIRAFAPTCVELFRRFEGPMGADGEDAIVQIHFDVLLAHTGHVDTEDEAIALVFDARKRRVAEALETLVAIEILEESIEASKEVPRSPRVVKGTCLQTPEFGHDESPFG